MPPKRIQIIFIIVERQPVVDWRCTVVLPKGHNANMPSFRVCMPKGIPMIVIIKSKLATIYSMATTIPPKISQIKLPKVFMCSVVG
jgi:hypothetical protein